MYAHDPILEPYLLKILDCFPLWVEFKRHGWAPILLMIWISPSHLPEYNSQRNGENTLDCRGVTTMSSPPKWRLGFLQETLSDMVHIDWEALLEKVDTIPFQMSGEPYEALIQPVFPEMDTIWEL